MSEPPMHCMAALVLPLAFTAPVRAAARIEAGCPGSFSTVPVSTSLPPRMRSTCRFWSM
jgi:hypothetical protein